MKNLLVILTLSVSYNNNFQLVIIERCLVYDSEIRANMVRQQPQVVDEKLLVNDSVEL